MITLRWLALATGALAGLFGLAHRQVEAQADGPIVRVVSAPRLTLPGEIDSNNPLVWSVVDGVPQLVLLTSWGGVPVRSTGADLERLQRGGPVSFTSHPGHGMWIE